MPTLQMYCISYDNVSITYKYRMLSSENLNICEDSARIPRRENAVAFTCRISIYVDDL